MRRATTTKPKRHHATKSPAQLDREINESLRASGAGRYVLVNNQTGKDMRPALDFEVKELQKKRFGIGMLELGGVGMTPKLYEVRLRDLDAPSKEQRKGKKDIQLPEGTTVKARRFYVGNIDGDKLYYDELRRSFRTIEQAKEYARTSGWRRPNSVIIEDQDVAKGGKIYGSRQVLHSMIDGAILEVR